MISSSAALRKAVANGAVGSRVPGDVGADDGATFHRPRPSEMVSSIVASVAASADEKDSTRTIAVLCDNESGVLSRVAGTLSARGFNIDSLTVSSTNLPELSRMTVVMSNVTDVKAAQALKQLADIVNVWAVVDYTGTNSLSRELAMVKVEYLPPGAVPAGAGHNGMAPPISYRSLIEAQPHRRAVRDIGLLFGGEVVDVGTQHITFQLTSWPKRVEAFIQSLAPFGIIETARSGVVTMLRSNVAGTEADTIPALNPHASGEADAAALPPG